MKACMDVRRPCHACRIALPVRKKAATISETVQTSLNLLVELGSPQAVAEARGLKETTVYAHVAKGLALDKVELDQAVDLTEAQKQDIKSALERHGPLLTPVMEALDNAYSYNVVRCVQIWHNRRA